jgi:hypothetical protein
MGVMILGYKSKLLQFLKRLWAETNAPGQGIAKRQ